MELISVIVPTYNRAAFLRKSIDSVLEQSYPYFELLVVDDGSTDGTKERLSAYRKNDARIRYIEAPHKGPSTARNRGIAESGGDLVAFLDSDDWWAPDKLAVQFSAMQQRPEYLISHTQEIWYKNGKLLQQKKKHKKYGGGIFEQCLPLCAVSMSTVMIRRKLFDQVGYFNEEMPCCEDYDFWLRASAFFPLLLIDKPLTLKEGGRPDQVSSIFARGMDKFRIESLTRLVKDRKITERQRLQALQELERKCAIYGAGCIKHGRKEEGEFYLGIVEQLKR